MGNDHGLAIDDLTVTAILGNTPTLTANPASLTGSSGLTYVQGGGPASGTVSVSGSNFTVASGSVTAASSSPDFTVLPTSTTFSSSSLAATAFTVNLISGLTAGTYATTVTFEGGGATVVVPVSGTVTAATPLPMLSINDVTQAEGNAGTSNFSFTVSLSTPAPTGGVTFDIATQDNTATTADNDYVSTSLTNQAIPAGSSTYSFSVLVNGDATAESNETFFVNVTNITNANAGDTQGQGTITNDDVTITKIHAIQGSGTAATAGIYTVEGVVVGAFPNLNPAGFYLQEEDTDVDGNALTSEGIFVVSSTSVNVGDRVRVSGTVQENGSTPSFNQAVFTASSTVLAMATGQQATVTPTAVTLPTAAVGDLERYEGMLVTFTSLTVTETFNLGRFGEVVLANGRLLQPTNVLDPNDDPAIGTNSSGTSNVTAVTALQNLNNRSRIILDDGSSASNPTTVPYIDAVTKTLRIGSTVSSLTGVLGFAFSAYRIQPTITPVFTYAVRPSVPSVGANVNVASFNVLNYFNGDGAGGGFPTARGATTSSEFTRQRDKISTAISQLNADVVGLVEVENDGDGPTSAIADLVNALNAATAPNTYSAVALANTTGSPGTDEIKVAFIYKPATVTPSGNAIYFNDAAFNSARPPLAQMFQVNATGGKFTPIINHFKSKGGNGAAGADVDQGDGQSQFNATRKAQASALLTFIGQVQTSSADNDVLVLGDLNAYNEEDPIDILRAGGLTKLVTATDSYVFDGQTGSLDHALTTASLLAQVTGAAKWNINADEPTALDYNDNVLTGGEPNIELRNDVTLFNGALPFRSSDHDPVLVGLTIAAPPAATLVASTSAVCPGAPVVLSATVAGLSGATYALTISNGIDQTTATGLSASAVSYTLTPTVPGAFTLSVLTSTSLTTSAVSGSVVISTIPTNVSLTSATITCSNPALTLTATATGATGYTLSNGQSNTTGSFIVNSATTYTITVSNASGCTASAMATVISNTAPPIVTLQPSSQVFCSGSSVTLTASGGSSYTFTGPGGFTQQGASSTATVNQTGTYTVRITDADGCSNTASVAISELSSNATFTLPTSGATVCTGSTFTLPVQVSGQATTFQWYRDGVFLSNQTSATLTLSNVQPGDAGSYSLVVNGGCGSAGSSAFNLTINLQPTITLIFPGGTILSPTALPTIQLPNPAQVLVQAQGGLSYHWQLIIDRLNGYEIRKVETNTTGLFTIDKPGPYRVTVSGSNGCSRTVEGNVVN